ncbi:MAG TPA: polyprenyl synthetase family protein [Roseiflexaceae bacterium]|nr:polyprenyl synthetase family protein [Roseiflexaceae bacterium]
MNPSHPRELVQNAMREAFPEAEARVAEFYGLQEYHLGWRDERLQPAYSDPGKLLRPVFCLLSCQAVGGDPRQALPLAAGIQLMHDFSLIHDDIEDQSDTRRGRPTVWTKWGMAQGINTGDGMLIVSHLSLHRMVEAGVRPEIVLDVLHRFDQTVLSVCEGQFLDINYEGNLAINEDDYLSMISRKTAALIAASTELGALVGGADDKTAQAMFDFGQNLGLAFQIQDDVLGIWGDPEETGKPFAADLLRRKLSLPVIHALNSSEREELARLYQKQETAPGDISTMLDILERTESRRYVEHVSEQYHCRAMAALDAIENGDSRALAEMRRIAEGLLKRRT